MKLAEIKTKKGSCRCGKLKCRGECLPKPDKSCRCGKIKCQGECAKLNEITKKDFVKGLSDQTHAAFLQKFERLRKEVGENWNVSIRDKSNKFIVLMDPVGQLLKDLEADVNYDELEETEVFRVIDIMNEIFPRSRHKYGNTTTGNDHTIGYILYKDDYNQ